MKRNFQVVLACTLDCGIGKSGTIPWTIPEDLQRFRKITCSTESAEKENMVIMGRKTWESLPKRPLPGRMNVVVTKTGDIESAVCVSSLEQALALAENDPCIEKIFVIGGAQLYNEAMAHPMCNKLYVTMINELIECDTFFDENLMEHFHLSSISDVQICNSIEYAFAVFHRN